MDKKIKFLLILNLITFGVLILLFFLSSVYGISFRGRIIERGILVLFIFSSISGLLLSTRQKNKRSKLFFIFTSLTPLIIGLVLLIISPLLLLHFSTLTISSSFSNEKIFYEDESFKVIKGESLMTNELYYIKSKHFIYEKVEVSFQTNINLENSKITYNDNYVEITKENSVNRINVDN